MNQGETSLESTITLAEQVLAVLRALAGFWTGGRVYGYTSMREENPPDPLSDALRRRIGAD